MPIHTAFYTMEIICRVAKPISKFAADLCLICVQARTYPHETFDCTTWDIIVAQVYKISVA